MYFDDLKNFHKTQNEMGKISLEKLKLIYDLSKEN